MPLPTPVCMEAQGGEIAGAPTWPAGAFCPQPEPQEEHEGSCVRVGAHDSAVPWYSQREQEDRRTEMLNTNPRDRPLTQVWNAGNKATFTITFWACFSSWNQKLQEHLTGTGSFFMHHFPSISSNSPGGWNEQPEAKRQSCATAPSCGTEEPQQCRHHPFFPLLQHRFSENYGSGALVFCW